MKSAQMIVGVAVVIAVAVICGTEGIPRPQISTKDYVEVDGFAFDGPVDGSRSSASSTRRPPNTFPTFRPTNAVPTFTPPLATPSTVPPTSSGPVTQSPELVQCIQGCQFRVTSEYNPVCGTDGNVYKNPGTVGCARACGHDVSQAYLGPCNTAIRG